MFLLHFNFLHCFVVKTNTCKHCSSSDYYDGSAEGILNMGTYMVGHDLLQSYQRQYLLNGYGNNVT